MIRRAFPLVLALALPACAAQDAAETAMGEAGAEMAASAVDAAAEEQRIRELAATFNSGTAARDAAAIVGLYAPDARFLAPNAPAVQGTEAIRQSWDGFLAIPNLSLVVEPTHIEISADGTLAYEVGTFQLAADGEAGPIQDTGKYVVVWKKLGGDWKIVADIFNSDLPLPQS